MSDSKKSRSVKLDPASDLTWKENQITDELLKGYLNSILHFTSILQNYYHIRIRRKRNFSNALGIISVIFFTSTILLPIFNDVLTPNAKITMYEWGYICGILASTTLLINRLFGHTQAYLRYVTTYYDLNQIVSKNNGIWLQNLNDYDLDNLKPDEVDHLIEVLMTFDESIRTLISEEIEEWKKLMLSEWAAFRKSVGDKTGELRTKLEEERKTEREDKKKKKEAQEAKSTPAIINYSFTNKPKTSIAKITITGIQHDGVPFEKELKATENQNAISALNIPQGNYSYKIELTEKDQLKEIIEKGINISSGGIIEIAVTFNL